MINYDKEQTGSEGLLCNGFITIMGNIKRRKGNDSEYERDIECV